MLIILSGMLIKSGQYEHGVALQEEAERYFEALGTINGLVYINHCIADAAYWIGDFNRMADCLQKALHLNIDNGPTGFSLFYLLNLGTAFKRLGKADQSLRWYLQAVAESRRHANLSAAWKALSGLAGTAALLGQPALGAHLLGAVQTAFSALSTGNDPIGQCESERDTAFIRAALGEPAFSQACDMGQRMNFNEAMREASSLAVSGIA